MIKNIEFKKDQLEKVRSECQENPRSELIYLLFGKTGDDTVKVNHVVKVNHDRLNKGVNFPQSDKLIGALHSHDLRCPQGYDKDGKKYSLDCPLSEPIYGCFSRGDLMALKRVRDIDPDFLITHPNLLVGIYCVRTDGFVFCDLDSYLNYAKLIGKDEEIELKKYQIRLIIK